MGIPEGTDWSLPKAPRVSFPKPEEERELEARAASQLREEEKGWQQRACGLGSSELPEVGQRVWAGNV